MNGKELALKALKKEHKLLSKKADKAKELCEEYLSVGTELLAIRREFAKIVKTKTLDQENLKKLNVLQVRSKKASKIQNSDFRKLCDNETKSKSDADNLGSEVVRLELRLSL